MTYAKRLRKLFLFSMKNRRLRGHLTAACSYWKVGCRGDGVFSQTRSRMRGNKYKMEWGKFQLGLGVRLGLGLETEESLWSFHA